MSIGLSKDITLPDGTVRHNVGSDNLSDEDRASMNDDLQAWIDAGCPEHTQQEN